MIGFFKNSKDMISNEFTSFSDIIFSSNPELVNISIIDQNNTKFIFRIQFSGNFF